MSSHRCGHTCSMRPEAFKDEESAVSRDLRASIGKEVTIKPDVQLHHEQFDVMAV